MIDAIGLILALLNYALTRKYRAFAMTFANFQSLLVTVIAMELEVFEQLDDNSLDFQIV